MTDQPLADRIAETTGKAADLAKEGLASAVSVTKDTVQAVTGEVGARASETVATVKDVASARIDDVRVSVVATGERLAQSLAESAEEASGLQGRMLSGLASGVSVVTGGLRDNRLEDAAEQLRDLARRHPGLFVAGAAVAGFALARFLRSTESGGSRS